MNPGQAIVEVYSMLVERCTAEGGITGFSPAERVVWFLVSMRCEIDIGGLDTVFDQLLSLDEVGEVIRCLRDFGQDQLATLFQQAVDLLNTHEFDNRQSRIFDLPESVLTELERIGDEVIAHNGLWQLDPQLCELLGLS